VRLTAISKVTAALVAFALVVAACGDDNGSEGTPAATSAGANPSATAGATTTRAADPLTAIGIDVSKCGSGYAPTKGIANNEILIGQSVPQTGTFAGFGLLSTSLKAYFDYANAELNGVNGKKLKLVVKDDAYEPDRTSKNVDELITKDGVFAFSGVLGTPNNLAVWDKLNEQCIPHLFPSTGAPDWGDVVNHPWTVSGAVVPYNLEARMWVDYLKTRFPNGTTVAILEADNDFGKSYDFWFKKFIAGTNIKIADTQKHDPAAPNVTNQMTTLGNSKAEVAIAMTTTTYCTQFLKGIGDNPNWKPALKLVSGTCRSSLFIGPAGPGATDALFAAAGKDLGDPALAQDPDVVKVRQLAVKYGIPENLLAVSLIPTGWLYGEILRDVLVRADGKPGGLTRPNVLLAARETDFKSGLILPNVSLKLAGKTDAYLIEAARFDKWNGATFEKAGDVVSTYEGKLAYEKPL
jgi:ABC-type branched-subunit amino acid transport system substrate-binding protein